MEFFIVTGLWIAVMSFCAGFGLASHLQTRRAVREWRRYEASLHE